MRLVALWAAFALAAGGWALAGWAAVPDPAPLDPWRRRMPPGARLQAALLWAWRRLVHADVRARMDRLGIRPAPLATQAAAYLAAGGVVAAGVLRLPPAVLVPGLLAAAWWLPGWTARGAVRRYQAAVTAGFPLLINHLRLLFDLGSNLPAAIRATVPRLPPRPAREMARVLRDLERGRPAEQALLAFADRIGTMEAATFAVALSQAVGQRLAGDALDPLETMVQGLQRQRMHALTGAVRSQITVVTPLAFLGALLVGGYLFVMGEIQALGFGGLHF